MLDGIPNLPFPKARRHALRLRPKRIHRKIARVEEEIAEAESRSQLAPLACDIA